MYSNDFRELDAILNKEKKLSPLERIKRGESPDLVQADIIKYPGYQNIKLLTIEARVYYSPKVFQVHVSDIWQSIKKTRLRARQLKRLNTLPKK